MPLLQQAWNFILNTVGNVVPVERWVRAIGNMLQFFGYAFVLLFLLVFLLIVGVGPFTGQQRVDLIHSIFWLMLGALVLSVILALLPGDLMFSPKERSLNRGRGYGTQANPKRRSEARREPAEPAHPILPKPEDKKTLPDNRETRT